MSQGTDRIRLLNDQFRKTLQGGHVFMTPGIAALGEEAVGRLFRTIAVFDDFCEANDPHRERDFGAFDFDERRVFFKIDYYDQSLTAHSPDPTNPDLTQRVITVMLAEEY